MYLVFAGADYYAAGGWNDFIASHGSLDSAKDSVEPVSSKPYSQYKIDGRFYDWYQIVNARTLKMVEDG